MTYLVMVGEMGEVPLSFIVEAEHVSESGGVFYFKDKGHGLMAAFAVARIIAITEQPLTQAETSSWQPVDR